MNTESHPEIILMVVAVVVLYLLIGIGIAWAYDEEFKDDICGGIIYAWIILVPSYLFVLLIKKIASILIKTLKIK